MTVPVPDGFRLAATRCGLTKGDRKDLGLIVADEACPATAAFTTNRIVAAPVALCREHLRRNQGLVRAILVNAGCANACTGPEGDQDAVQCATWVAERAGCPVEQVLVFSTGVIGKRLDTEKIEASLDELFGSLANGSEQVDGFARAIMTTDTVPKLAGRTIETQSGPARALGFAKGSGMIHPDMATMLAFLLTDTKPALSLELSLRALLGESFHSISVDGDTSTNDSVLLWTSGKHEVGEAEFEPLHAGLTDLSTELARAIAKDGEGASKLIEVRVTGAMSPSQARACASTIAQSLLVKTAVHGQDPNWGRILAAAGRSGADMDTRKLRLGIGDACLFENDRPLPANEPAAAEHLEGDSVVLWIDLASGQSATRFWTCDLTAEYVSINADYRT